MKERLRMLLIACMCLMASVQAYGYHEIIFKYHGEGSSPIYTMKKDTIVCDGVAYRFVLDGNVVIEYNVGIPTYFHISEAHFEAIDYDKSASEVSFRDDFVCRGNSADPYSDDVVIKVESDEVFYPSIVDFDPWEPHDRLKKSAIIDVTGFGDNLTFMENYNLESVKLPKNISAIPPRFFLGCGILVLTLPDGVRVIGEEAFMGVPAVNIPTNVTSIGRGAFAGCYITSGNIPSTVNYIGEYAFTQCRGLTSVTIPSSLKSIEEGVFEDCNDLTSVTIPSNVTSVGRDAFYGCSGLTSLTIHPGVSFIASSAFSYCTSLTSVTIPSSVKAIYGNTFNGCSGLTSITVQDGNTVYDSRGNCNAIIETASNTLIRGCQTTVIPTNVTSIGNYAFSGCTGLTSITIPSSVTNIGPHPFQNCSSLSSILVEKGNKSYDSRNDCNAIIETASNTLIQGCQNTIIPSEITSIAVGAFWGSSNLTSISIPSGVTNIGDDAFYYCRNLSSVTSLIEEPFEISRNVFDWIPYNATLYVPKGTKEKYETTSAWNEFQNIVELDEVLTGVETVSQEYGAAMVTERYSLDGQRIGIGQRGLNIVRMSNGTARKVIVK